MVSVCWVFVGAVSLRFVLWGNSYLCLVGCSLCYLFVCCCVWVVGDFVLLCLVDLAMCCFNLVVACTAFVWFGF